ncbi:16S rRNA (guanine(527)-N(7))-methyltransferase RsmG [Moellerella wisconsensis]|uniref:Ribosomal RNA small subunit methyltransferase G n=1 Tax=Moellerella wisconsensis TaxID=158849 RepID=A0A9Q8V4L6_9GAMM|nr:16S rRNA (guanine(527)-N(7))-methyltransferase RsmG [Moellerella wisconsensis]UNH30786.1 16S rRNA (guanine(527)-N(7))-methyltransferase RsmG [Moellerella wisconsensis]UNH42466.1 16S rRNA (guanine(527)-N(7))-methyltransferase RsmG [Moellerella wisconsensis]
MGLLPQLNKLLIQAGIELTEPQKQQLISYVEMLHKWNKAYNLTSVRAPEQMIIRHILDSIVVNEHLDGERFIDVGTGPGLPGVPLAIIRPESHFVLLDSLGKRVRFLRQVQHELGLNNIEPIQSRVEEYQPEIKFDGVISRAFASLTDMLHWCAHLPQTNGRFYALKGAIPEDEIALLPDNYPINRVMELKVPELDEQRHLVIIDIK